MHQQNTVVSQPKWYDSGHASLCVLGTYLRQIGPSAFIKEGPLQEALSSMYDTG
jgi:hypothetical protein